MLKRQGPGAKLRWKEKPGCCHIDQFSCLGCSAELVPMNICAQRRCLLRLCMNPFSGLPHTTDSSGQEPRGRGGPPLNAYESILQGYFSHSFHSNTGVTHTSLVCKVKPEEFSRTTTRQSPTFRILQSSPFIFSFGIFYRLCVPEQLRQLLCICPCIGVHKAFWIGSYTWLHLFNQQARVV